MTSFTLLTSEQECQTVLQCTPHILAEDGTALVQSANMCQTEITIDPTEADVDLQSLLGYLPSDKIERDFVNQIKPHRKIKIQFILPKKSLPKSEQISANPEPSKTEIVVEDDESDQSVTDQQKTKDEEVTKIYPILKKTVGRALPTESIECQTTLFVYPHFLNDNQTGTVTAEISIQTAFTFTPQCSLSNILPKLKSYLHHDGRVIDCGDGFKRNNVIDFIRELLGDIVSMHENLFDPNCILPELPTNLALEVGKSTYTNTETNSSSTATNTGKSLELISASTSPSQSVHSVNEYKSSKQSITEIGRDTSASKYLPGLINRPTCDCCNYSPCCSDIQINIIIDRQPFDKCCSKTGVDQQIAVYFLQQPVDSIIEEILDEIINNITKSVPNMEKQLIPIGNIDYSQQFDFNSMHDPQSLQIVPYIPSMLEEIVKEKMKNIDPFKFCTEVGTQCDCKNEEEEITKWTSNQRNNLLALPSTSTEPDLEFGLVTPTISNPNSVLSNKLAVSLPSKIAEKTPNKIHICKCPKDKPTVGCFCCSDNINMTAEEIITVCNTMKSLEIDNPYLDIEDKSIQTPSLKAIEYNIQKEEELKMPDKNKDSKNSMVEMYKHSTKNPVHQSVQIDVGPEQGLVVKPSKVVTIQDKVISEYHIPLKRTQETMHLNYSSPQNNCVVESCKEPLRIELPDDTDEETDDDYTTATSSPTNVKNPENIEENDPERKTSREEMMKLLLDLKIIDSSVNQHQLETLTKSDVSKKSSNVENKSIPSVTTTIASTKSISKNSERKKNFLNLYKMTDTYSAISSAQNLQSGHVSQLSQMITIITQGLKSDYPSTQALYFSKEVSAPLSIISKKDILSTQQSTATNNVQFILIEDDDTDTSKTYKKCLPNCSEHIIATKCLECAKVKNVEPENICAAKGLPKSPLKVCAATENLKPPTKTVSLNSNTTSKTLYTQERVISAVKICESQLQPLRDAFIDLKQKLKQLNIPEVNCIFETNEVDPLNSNKFRIRVATNPDPSKCGIHTTNTKIKLVPPTKPSSSHSNINTCSSRVSSRQSCRSVRNAQRYLPNNYPSVTPRCQSASQDWKRYYSCLLHYDENAPCLRRPTSTQHNFSNCGMMQNKSFQASNSSSYCSLNVARTEDSFECSNNASQYNFSHVSSEEFQECPYRNNNYYPGNYMYGGPRYNYY